MSTMAEVSHCERCAQKKSTSMRSTIRAILDAEPNKSFRRADVFLELKRRGRACEKCTPLKTLTQQLHHLRHDGVAESIGKGMYRKRSSGAQV
jgi:hypothetical protein